MKTDVCISGSKSLTKSITVFYTSTSEPDSCCLARSLLRCLGSNYECKPFRDSLKYTHNKIEMCLGTRNGGSFALFFVMFILSNDEIKENKRRSII